MEDDLNRPVSVTTLSLFVLCITAWNAARLGSTIASWDILKEFGAPTVYIAGTGLFWMTAGLWLAYATWTGQKIAFRAGLVIAALFFTWYWLDRLAIQPSPAPNVLFSGLVSAVLLIYAIINLIVAKPFFDKERG